MLNKIREVLLDEEKGMYERYAALFALRNDGGKEAVAAIIDSLSSKSALLRHEVWQVHSCFCKFCLYWVWFVWIVDKWQGMRFTWGDVKCALEGYIKHPTWICLYLFESPNFWMPIFSVIFRLHMFWVNCKTKLLQLLYPTYLKMWMSTQWLDMKLLKLLAQLQVLQSNIIECCGLFYSQRNVMY